MKFRNLLAVMALSLCAMSCSDDDTTLGDLVKGDYKGTTDMSVMNSNSSFESVATIAAQDDDHVILVLPAALGEAKAMEMPAIKVENVNIAKTGENSYSLEIDAIDVVVNDVNYVSDGLKGSIKNDSLFLNYAVKPGAMPMPIHFSFKGKR